MSFFDRFAAYPSLLLAAALLSAGLYLAVRKHHILSGYSFAAIHILLSVLITFVPMMSREGRVDKMAPAALGLMVVYGLGVLVAMLLARDSETQKTTIAFRWKFLPRQVWYYVLASFSFMDTAYTFATYGSSPLVMASGGGGGDVQAYYDAFGPLTYMAWAASLALFIGWVLEWFTTDYTLWAFSMRNVPETLLVGVTSMLTILSGSRHQILVRAVIFVTLAVRFQRIRIKLLIIGAVVMALFVSIVGAFRFGNVDVTLELTERYRDWPFASQLSWIVLYTEPNLNNLSLFLDSDPPPQYGLSWFSSIMPQGILGTIDVDRVNAMEWMNDNNLLAFRGLTLRTFFADFVMDFGLIGGGLLGFLVLAAYGPLSNRARRSGFWLVVFSCSIPCYYSFSGLNGLYQLQNVVLFAFPFIFNSSKKRRPRVGFTGIRVVDQSLAELEDQPEELEDQPEPAGHPAKDLPAVAQ